ncbi:MAG: serine/threonine protein kinase [Candidatus Eremiobacteraeota bacterium]|nr:serine/threonine protein kinase [Candidatus Eremiobacteraeota bacterium]MCW5871310.1 serine/threonine protein kinase [Candidatus Eremiobacteraeota bacterium]
MVIDAETCRLSEVMTRRYRLVSLLGQGGMGRVFLCEGEEGRVAVKVTEAHKQFRHEAGILKGLSHRHLVGVRDYLEEDGFGYLVMDYVPGETLAQRVARQGPVEVAKVLDWALQLCEVLDFLHGQNPKILFRDLKPSNVMVDSRDQLKLIDFGIARVQVTGVLTATFLQGIGSAGYAPLEQYQGAGSTDERSDIYALGATLYHLLTGRTPPSPIDLVAEDSQLPSVRYLNPQVPTWLDLVIKKMLATRKENRFQSASEAAMALRQMLTVEEDLPTEVLAPVRRREENVLYALTGVLTTAAVGLMGWLFVTSQATSEPLPPSSPPVILAAASATVVEKPEPLPASLPVAPSQKKTVKPILHKKTVVTPKVTPPPLLPEIAYPTRVPVVAKKETAVAEAPAAPPLTVAEPPVPEEVVPEVKPSPTETPPPIYSISLPPQHGPEPGGPRMGGGPGGFGGGMGRR